MITKTQNILEMYQELPERAKALMRLKALSYFKVPLDTWRECFYELTYLFPKNEPSYVGEFNTLVGQLKSRDLIRRHEAIPSALVHLLTRETVDFCEHGPQYLESLEKVALKRNHWFYSEGSLENQLRANRFRLSVYTLDKKSYEECRQKYKVADITRLCEQFFLQENLDSDWLKTRFLEVQGYILKAKLGGFLSQGLLEDQIPSLLTHYLALRKTDHDPLFDPIFLGYDMLAGNTKKVAQTVAAVKEENSAQVIVIKGGLAFLENDHEASLLYFETALKTLRKLANKKNILFGPQETFFYILALFKSASPEQYQQLHSVLNLATELMPRQSGVFEMLLNVLLKLQGRESKVAAETVIYDHSLDPLSKAIGALAVYWFDKTQVDIARCREGFDQYKDLLPMIGKIFAEILQAVDIPQQKEYDTYLNKEQFTGLVRFVDCVHMAEHWERALLNLNHFFDRRGSGSSQPPKRLAWYFNPIHHGVDVLEQSFQAKGGWSKGKSIALKRFYEQDPKLDYLTEDDKRVIKTLRREPHGWYNQHTYSWDPVKTPLALVGHPCVYHIADNDMRLELVLGALGMRVEQQEPGYVKLFLSHTSDKHAVFIEKETPSRYSVIEFPQDLVVLTDIVGHDGIKIPANQQDQVIPVIQKAAPFLRIHSDVDVIGVPAQEGDPTPCLQITPFNEGLQIALLVRPFGDQGPYLRPGHGRTPLIHFLEGQSLKANRSLTEERKRADSLIQSCPVLQRSQDGSDEWTIEDPEDCLEILSSLQELSQAGSSEETLCRIEWPEGQKLFVTEPSSIKKLSLKIASHKDWLSVQGSFNVDEETVIGFEKLLDLLDKSTGRFIPLEGNKFLALSSHFKKQLQDLKAISQEMDTGSGKEYRLHALGGLALQKFANEAGFVEGDKKWKEKLKAIKKAEKYQPKLPTTLQATLRDYQQEGFEWMSRLASLGMGMCLADDMGLGKTLQALAVLLNHAPEGPCLVVAPTSVCHNWIAEMAKFAPTLVSYTLDGSSKREELVQSLKAMDVLVCSYTLLQQEEDILAKKKWQVIVLDEAQSIKNSETKRFKAAISLQGNVKMALTGTPIENHLEEIWSLFQFIAPGLLGSRKAFQKRFLTSLDEDKDKARLMGLKKLIQLFVLRRTKNAVLQELPPRTDQTILVEMNPEELSFYEALRRQALANISNLQDQSGRGKRKIFILSEITRLRRACCHPNLVNKDIKVNSSKMKVFLELVEELLDNNHQALVFSQYVGYLTMIREALDQKKIAYQYLDGSTPAAERKSQVQAFQEGKSSLFLLSLKAGGTGLNLTAADYVIHLDPWWNPAVEDQASDRAHRMGQQRPVTIYRLIMQNSIEEKILELHKSKREMAAEILEGSDTPSKMSEEDLLNLISAEL